MAVSAASASRSGAASPGAGRTGAAATRPSSSSEAIRMLACRASGVSTARASSRDQSLLR